jgi:hypothetical protein
MRTNPFLFAAPLVAAHVMMGLAAPSPQTPSAPALPGAMVTVVGCLTRENVAPQPGTAPRGTAVEPAPFVLTDEAPPPPATGTASGSSSSGATASGGQKPGRRMYVLRTEGTSVDLSQHLNHGVRVTGATTAPMTTAPLAGRSPEATPIAGATAPAGATGTVFDTANLPTLVVTSLTMVSATCN